MNTSSRASREIDGDGRTVRQLLANRKYSIDYYQREYKWQRKQVAELLEDLATKFLDSHEAGHERSAVAEYGHYFLGSIIVSDKNSQKFIIDGQQRLTRLTLLLIFLQHKIADPDQKGQIADLIFSLQYGKPADMLKGYLLANIADAQKRTHVSNVWKDRVQALAELGKDEDADGIKAWLRSQHADSIRERKAKAQPQDFELIGTEFHRWVRDHENPLGLAASADFAGFIDRDFAFYSRWYERLRRAADALTPGLDCIHFNAQNNFTLQYPVLLAPLRLEDDEATALRKIRIAAVYLDVLINRRIWNWRAIDYSTMQYAMFLVMRDIRGKSPEELAAMLRDRLYAETETFAPNDRNDHFGLHAMNGPQIHRLLARVTDYVETRSGQTSRYAQYAKRGRGGYEIEHIWADHPDRHTDEFAHPAEFQEYRNRIGGLLLLPKSFNASYGDLPYAEKREHYAGQNLLARSLHERAYDHNPGFSHFIAESGLPFRPHAEFRKADLDARQALYRKLAEQIWSPERLAREATS
jgi:hypothetical protein